MDIYKRVDLSTTKGFQEAEKMQRSGWKVYQIGFQYIIMIKKQ